MQRCIKFGLNRSCAAAHPSLSACAGQCAAMRLHTGQRAALLGLPLRGERGRVWLHQLVGREASPEHKHGPVSQIFRGKSICKIRIPAAYPRLSTQESLYVLLPCGYPKCKTGAPTETRRGAVISPRGALISPLQVQQAGTRHLRTHQEYGSLPGQHIPQPSIAGCASHTRP